MKDPATQKFELMIDALRYALDHGLDVQNEADIHKILAVLDPKHNQDVDEFIELLKTSDIFMGMKAKEKKSKEPQLPN